ncbi:MAG: metal ABC transporter permease, partial [Chloroflexota bacterium]|nr:metal ABC transporter permease [Chloroflexota bacterium]
IVVAMNVVGVTLLAAAIVIPPATARLLTDRFGRMALLSTLLGAGTGFTGMYASYFFDIASGAAIVLLATALFILAYAVTGLLRLLPHRHPAPALAGIGQSGTPMRPLVPSGDDGIGRA